MRKCITSDEAIPSDVQHARPCSDCPFARAALPGWLGPHTVEEWLEFLHGEVEIPCHAIAGPQCAGAAIYRANVGKIPRNPELLRLKANTSLVFANREEFLTHHRRIGVKG